MGLELLGTIREIWRYPVSSMGGEQLTSVEINNGGIGDRIWCIVDAVTGQPAAPEKEGRWRPILFLQSRLRSDIPEIGFPEGEWISIEDAKIAMRLSTHFGFDVAARPYRRQNIGILVRLPPTATIPALSTY